MALKPFYNKKLHLGADKKSVKELFKNLPGLPFITEAPEADNESGIIIVVLDAEPATYYDGYLYIITE